jgi:uncharacterized membrane protein YphA (DoxX/SURF4 family)
VRRLFSTFAHGWPGVGLLVMRAAVGATVIVVAITSWLPGLSFGLTIRHVIAITGGSFLILGLWTPVAGSIVAIIQLWAIFSQPGDAWTRILVAALAAGLAMVGPGAWSIDARLFGWKRLNFRDRNS